MSEADIRHVIRQKYGEAARRVVQPDAALLLYCAAETDLA